MIQRALLPVFLAGTAFFATGEPAFAQATVRVSVSSSGQQANGESWDPVISADGRFIAFCSSAPDLVAGDGNGLADIFVHEYATGVTERVSLDSSGGEANGLSGLPAISADGRFVVFHSDASNLVPADTNGVMDVFLRDRLTGLTERVSLGASGLEANGGSGEARVSADGRCVVFGSSASNLVAGDSNGFRDVFVRDRIAGTTELVSLSSLGAQGNGPSLFSSISGDGRRVVFTSLASTLVPGDTNGWWDIFVHDRLTAVTERSSVNAFGVEGNNDSFYAAISADGRFVAFDSSAWNLVPGDTNSNWDVFVRDLETGGIELVSLNSQGGHGNHRSENPQLSIDGSRVVFSSVADNLVPGDTNAEEDAFLRDRSAGLTERLSVDSLGAQGGGRSGLPSVSGSGRWVAFRSWAEDLVPGDDNGMADIFVRDRGPASVPGANTILLCGPFQAQTGSSVRLSWFGAPPSSPYWLAWSLSLNGAVIGGHGFDLGQPLTVLDTGVNSLAGGGVYDSASVPAAAAGRTVYFELAALDATGGLHDSNPLVIAFS